ATFVGRIGEAKVVYKPVAGERPLWDFPDGTLAGREVAAYEVSEALGWDIVPRTWLRDGPFGIGMAQLWRQPDPEQEAVTLVPAGEQPAGWCHVLDGLDPDDRPVSLIHEGSPALRRIAVFDVVVNNADRKGGHVLEMPGGHRHGVDHGLTFHQEHKLRTVLWGWPEPTLDENELTGVRRVRAAAAEGAPGRAHRRARGGVRPARRRGGGPPAAPAPRAGRPRGGRGGGPGPPRGGRARDQGEADPRGRLGRVAEQQLL